MRHRLHACTALALALFLLGGCKDRHEPLKPTVIPIGAATLAQ